MNNNGKQVILAVIIVSILSVSCLTIVSVDTDGADGTEGYVKINITWDSAYDNDSELQLQINAAATELNKQHDSLNAANEALRGLFGDNGALHHNYVYNDEESGKYRPVQTIEYEIHGTVPLGSGTIRLGMNDVYVDPYKNEYGPVFNDIRITGIGNDAKITGAGTILAQVAGGYENWFVESGSITVRNIEFTEETSEISIDALGSVYESTNEKESEATLNIDNCKFHTMLYIYNGDFSTSKVVKNISSCEFANGGEKSFAIFIQGYATDVYLSNNVVSGYPRGINIEEQHADAPTDFPNVLIATIQNNVFKDNTDNTACCIQLTNAKKIIFEDNRLENIVGNAFKLHEAGSITDGIDIRNNFIQAEYLILDKQSGKTQVKSSDNLLDIDNPGLSYDDKLPIPVIPSAIDINGSVYEPPMPPSYDDDDEFPFIPGQNSSGKDDTTTYIAVAAAAAVVAVLAVLVMAMNKGKL